jgi:DNA-binding transcriptional ArsR family regulator
MTNYQSTLDLTFQALADPTRRQVLASLRSGPASVSELAEPFEMALPSFMQHLRVLEKSGLVHSHKIGRVRTFKIVPEALKEAKGWLAEQLEFWDRRLNQLDNYLLEMANEEEKND